MASAAERIRLARSALRDEAFASAISVAYYAALYAARAALSEEEAYAKTHRGTWHLFHAAFVAPGRFDEAVYRRARDMQRLREAADYDAATPTEAEAEALVGRAERFVQAVEELLAR